MGIPPFWCRVYLHLWFCWIVRVHHIVLCYIGGGGVGHPAEREGRGCLLPCWGPKWHKWHINPEAFCWYICILGIILLYTFWGSRTPWCWNGGSRMAPTLPFSYLTVLLMWRDGEVTVLLLSKWHNHPDADVFVFVIFLLYLLGESEWDTPLREGCLPPCWSPS